MNKNIKITQFSIQIVYFHYTLKYTTGACDEHSCQNCVLVNDQVLK